MADAAKVRLELPAQTVADIFRQRVVYRGHEDGAWSELDGRPTPDVSNGSFNNQGYYDATRQG